MVSPEDQGSDVEDITSSVGLDEGFEDSTDSGNTTGDWEHCAWTLCAAVSLCDFEIYPRGLQLLLFRMKPGLVS